MPPPMSAASNLPPGPPVGPTSYPMAPPSSGSRALLIVLALVLVLAVVGAGGIWLAGRSGDERAEAGGSTSTVPVTTESVSTTTPSAADTEPPGPEELAHSVVQIQLLLDGEPVCTGSGTIIDADGLVVTNYHVVEQSAFCPHDQIGVAIAESSQAVPDLAYAADLLAFDADLDLAVVRIGRTIDGAAADTVFPAIEIGDSDQVELGDELRVIGFPGIGGETVTFTTGSVSGFATTAEGGERSWLKTDASITGGNSGGLAADDQGRFVGIPTRAGAGDGQVVDCRVIADSNGDGQLTDEDSCVPIGGFINGIRPVALALPLIEEARTASPIDQGPPQRDEPMQIDDLAVAFNPTWTSAVDADGFALDELVTAAAGIPEVCVTWDFDDLAVGSIIEGIWYLDGEPLEETASGPEPSEAPTFGSAFACLSADGGLDAGTYEYLWFEDDELVFGEGILVADGATAVIEVLNDSEVPVCVVQFNPTNTATWGLNELEEELAPGDSAMFDVAIGALDARVINCDGDVRIEDASGYPVSEDLVLTVD
jgi:hypothetical protein